MTDGLVSPNCVDLSADPRFRWRRAAENFTRTWADLDLIGVRTCEAITLCELALGNPDFSPGQHQEIRGSQRALLQLQVQSLEWRGLMRDALGSPELADALQRRIGELG